ncbi:hypothetical protein FRB90_009670 [Tulasnella sp. 427]|nr:hypothetical protein FRB90_009670 [Tulasnella sp. 427]
MKEYRQVRSIQSNVQIAWPSWGLPTEIFVDILLMTLYRQHCSGDEGIEPTALERLQQLRLVSSAWSGAILAAPILWILISSAAPPSLVEMALARSGKAGLHIRCYSSNSSEAATFMPQVVPHSSRWKVVELNRAAWNHIPEHLIERSAKCTVDEDFKALRTLTAHSVRFVKDCCPCLGRGLRSLTINQYNVTTGITSYQMYHLLLHNPSLITVDIEFFELSSPGDTLESLPDINLPVLRTFTLRGQGACARLHAPFLRNLRAPSCTEFSLFAFDSSAGMEYMLSGIEPYAMEAFGRVTANVSLSIFSSLGIGIVIKSTEAAGFEEEEFRLQTSHSLGSSTMKWLSSLLRKCRPHITCLSVSGDSCSEEGLLEDMPNVTDLNVFGRTTDLWSTLGQPIPSSPTGEPARWLLPNLSRVIVTCGSATFDEHDMLVDAIKARETVAVDDNPSGTQMKVSPKPLTTLTYSSTRVTGREGELKEILGDRFDWHYLMDP